MNKPLKAGALAIVACTFLFANLSARAQADDWASAQAAFADYDNRSGLQALRRGALAGDPRAMQAWGLALLHGARLFPGQITPDAQEAALWLKRAAHHCGEGVPPQPAQCAAAPIQLARQCPADAPAHHACPVVLNRPRQP